MSDRVEPASSAPSCYDVLQVHPAAPLDLITAAYWRLASLAQARRSDDPGAEVELHLLTRAYQILADSRTREEYDNAAGFGGLAPAPRLRKRKSLLRRRRKLNAAGDPAVNYYEILRITPDAEPGIIREAYSTLKNYYIRLIQSGSESVDLLDYLEEAYAITSDEERRRAYDAARHRRRAKPKSATSAAAAAEAGAPGEERTVDDGASKGDGPSGTRGVEGPQPPEPVEAAPEAETGEADLPGDTHREEPLIAGRYAWPEAAVTTDAPLKEAAAGGPGRSRGGRRLETQEPASAADKTRGKVISSLAEATTNVIESMGRQLSHLSTREAEKVEELAARRALERAPADDVEEVLLQRLSGVTGISAETQEAAAGPPPEPAAGGEPPVARLELLDGPDCGKTFELREFPVTLGGDDDCDITLPGLSSPQGRLVHSDGRIVLYDLSAGDEDDSSAPAWVLESGDDVTIGPYRLRFTSDGAEH